MRNINLILVALLIFGGAQFFPRLFAITAMQNPHAQAQLLDPGKPVERELKGGEVHLEIRSLEPAALAGKYEIRIEALRASEEKDTSLIQAFRLSADAGALRQKGDGASVLQAVEKYEQALPLWRIAGNKRKEAETLSNLGYLYYNYLGDSLKAREYHEQEAPLQHEIRDEFSSVGNLSRDK